MKKFKSVSELWEHMEDDCTWWDKFIMSSKMNWLRWLIYNLPDLPKDCYNKIKWFIQRGKRGYSDFDLQDFSWYMANMIKSVAINLQKTDYGMPSDCTEEEWNEILNKIAITFHTAELINNSNYLYLPTDDYNFIDYIKTKESMKDVGLFVMSYDDCQRYEKGWKLFQKYFNYLCD